MGGARRGLAATASWWWTGGRLGADGHHVLPALRVTCASHERAAVLIAASLDRA